jgi:hypothetical protein
MTLSVTCSDGYRIESGEMQIRDGWSELDNADCLETLGMTAAGLIRAMEASGLALYGDGAVDGFRFAYEDEEVTENEPAASPLPKVAGA